MTALYDLLRQASIKWPQKYMNEPLLFGKVSNQVTFIFILLNIAQSHLYKPIKCVCLVANYNRKDELLKNIFQHFLLVKHSIVYLGAHSSHILYFSLSGYIKNNFEENIYIYMLHE